MVDCVLVVQKNRFFGSLSSRSSVVLSRCAKTQRTTSHDSVSLAGH